jgi:hypothetical protein
MTSKGIPSCLLCRLILYFSHLVPQDRTISIINCCILNVSFKMYTTCFTFSTFCPFFKFYKEVLPKTFCWSLYCKLLVYVDNGYEESVSVMIYMMISEWNHILDSVGTPTIQGAFNCIISSIFPFPVIEIIFSIRIDSSTMDAILSMH